HILSYNEAKTNYGYNNHKKEGNIKRDVNIRIEVISTAHARYDRDLLFVEKSEYLDAIYGCLEMITISLMQQKVNINSRFLIRNKESQLNLICKMEPGENNFELKIIT